jgi:hypothetical protein
VCLGNKVDFQGIRLRLASTGFDEEAFQTIPAGQAVEVSFDAAELHDLATSGAYDFVANGVLSYAAADSTDIAGSVPYSSNTVTATVDGAEAAKARTAFMNKRTVRYFSLPFYAWIPAAPVLPSTMWFSNAEATNRLSNPTAPVARAPLPGTPSATAALLRPLPRLLP